MNTLVKKIGLALCGVLMAVCVAAGATGSLDLVAPGGGEMDLDKNVAQYYGNDDQRVEANWENLRLQADYLEYDQLNELVKAKSRVELIRKNAAFRQRIISQALEADLTREIMTAEGEVGAWLEEGTAVFGGYLRWERSRDWVQVRRNPWIEYQEWTIHGNLVEGQPEGGIWTISGQVVGVSADTTFKAGKLIVDRGTGKFYLQENPVVVRGANEVTAAEIIYDLKTKKVSAKGSMKTQLIN